MEQMTLTNDGARDVRFMGELIGSDSSRRDGDTRWTEVRIYRTSGGRYVAQIIGATQWQGERTRYTVLRSSDTMDGLADALESHDMDLYGHFSDVSKAALLDAGIDTADEID